MMNKPAFWKVTVTRMMMLVSMLLCLNTGACNCDNPVLLEDQTSLPDEPNTPTAPETSSIGLSIIPLDGTQLVQEHGKKFRIKLTNSGDSIDLTQLALSFS